jgi:5-enolpyruvylshikimate-3-phosphate synthase
MRATYTSIELGLGLGMGTHMGSRVMSRRPMLALTTPLERLGLAFHSLDELAGARRAT